MFVICLRERDWSKCTNSCVSEGDGNQTPRPPFFIQFCNSEIRNGNLTPLPTFSTEVGLKGLVTPNESISSVYSGYGRIVIIKSRCKSVLSVSSFLWILTWVILWILSFMIHDTVVWNNNKSRKWNSQCLRDLKVQIPYSILLCDVSEWPKCSHQP